MDVGKNEGAVPSPWRASTARRDEPELAPIDVLINEMRRLLARKEGITADDIRELIEHMGSVLNCRPSEMLRASGTTATERQMYLLGHQAYRENVWEAAKRALGAE